MKQRKITEQLSRIQGLHKQASSLIPFKEHSHMRFKLVQLVIVVIFLTLGSELQRTSHAQDHPVETFIYEAVDLANGAELMRARAQSIDLNAYPIIPSIPPSTYDIFKHGQNMGRDPHTVSKVGDCNSAEWLFLHPFGEGQYTLGNYTTLQSVIDYFGESLAERTYAAHNGLNAISALDPLWADPTVCQAGETPLACEYQLHNPSIAVIMFGSNDVLVLTPEQFDQYLRRIVQLTRQEGIIPVLSTFPRHLAHPEHSILFNQIVVRIALDYNIPLINLWRALEPLPSHGIDDDGFHLNGPVTGAGDFSTKNNLQTGYPQRNLVTLQTLQVIIDNVFQTHVEQ